MRGQPAGGLQELHDFFIGVDVRHQTPVAAPEGAHGRDLGGRLELAVVRRKGPHNLQPTCGGDLGRALDVLASPVNDQLTGQRTAMPATVRIAGEAHQFGARCDQFVAQGTALRQVAPHNRHQGLLAAHGRLPGHGIATAPSRAKSTLA